MPTALSPPKPRRSVIRIGARVFGVLVLSGTLSLTASLLWGGPKPAPPIESISAPFKAVSYEGLPAINHFTARDGVQLAYRRYAPVDETQERGSVMLVHDLFRDGAALRGR